jgi:hypothetical protein
MIGAGRQLFRHEKGIRCRLRKCLRSAPRPKGFEDAIQRGLTRAAETVRNIRSAWVKEQHVRCDGDRITEYQVNLMVTFVLDDEIATDQSSSVSGHLKPRITESFP